jgi:hypothetical protein
MRLEGLLVEIAFENRLAAYVFPVTGVLVK